MSDMQAITTTVYPSISIRCDYLGGVDLCKRGVVLSTYCSILILERKVYLTSTPSVRCLL